MSQQRVSQKRKVLFALFTTVTLLSSIVAVFAVTAITDYAKLHFNVPERSVYFYVQGTKVQGQTYGLGDLEAGMIHDIPIACNNAGSTNGTFVLHTTNMQPQMTFSMVSNETLVPSGSWLNTTLSIDIILAAYGEFDIDLTFTFTPV